MIQKIIDILLQTNQFHENADVTTEQVVAVLEQFENEYNFLNELAEGRLEQMNADRKQYLDLRDKFEAVKAIDQHTKELESVEPVGKFAKFTDGVWREVTDGSPGKPLYAAPQSAVPLTDEQIYDMYNEPRSDAEMVAFARAIERAHGIGEQQ